MTAGCEWLGSSVSGAAASDAEASGSCRVKGTVSVKVLPFHWRLRIDKDPPNIWAYARQMGNPRPLPFSERSILHSVKNVAVLVVRIAGGRPRVPKGFVFPLQLDLPQLQVSNDRPKIRLRQQLGQIRRISRSLRLRAEIIGPGEFGIVGRRVAHSFTCFAASPTKGGEFFPTRPERLGRHRPSVRQINIACGAKPNSRAARRTRGRTAILPDFVASRPGPPNLPGAKTRRNRRKFPPAAGSKR